MCETLTELRDGIVRYAAGFDAALLPPDRIEQVVRVAAAIEGVAGTLKALAAARLAEVRAFTSAGDKSAAHHLARTTGTSIGQAAETIATGRRLADLPEIAAAGRSGALSSQQTAAVADAAAADPSAESRLVDAASRSSMGELREECARTKAAAVPDLEARRKRIHAQRFLRTYRDSEGAWNLRARHNPEVGAEIMAALQPIRDRLFKEARAAGRQEPSEAYAMDALAELCRGGEAGRRGDAKVIVRVDLPTLLRGYPVDGEICELAGYGPIAVSAVRDMIESQDPFLAAVVTKGEAVVGVAHLGRRPTARQQTALQWLYPSCAVEGCGAVAFLEYDHRADWAKTHVTVFDLLDRLCSHHHDRKTVDGWSLVRGRGKRAFVPPNDPRHPRHARAPAHAPPAA